jgi:C-terminal processing protease CtpA/Prc
MLKHTLKALGWKLEWKSSGNRFEDYYGVVIDDHGRVSDVVFEGPADDVGIGQEMKITQINGQPVQKNAKMLFNQTEGAVQLIVEDKWREYELTVIPRSIPYKRKAELVEVADSEIRRIWMSKRLPQ